MNWKADFARPTVVQMAWFGSMETLHQLTERDVRRFQEEQAVRVALLSITACSLGITLTAASHVIFAELHTVPGIMRQAEDRAHRIGQQRCVDVHYLVAHGSIDDNLLESCVRKRDELGMVFNLQNQHREQQRAESQMIARSSSQCECGLGADESSRGDPNDLDGSLAQLVSMGFDAGVANAALHASGGQFEAAMDRLVETSQIVEKPCIQSEPSAFKPGSDVDASAMQREGLDDAVAQLVGMGFEVACAHDALKKAGGRLEGALETLLAHA